jgi:hypothetical protein
MQPTAPSCPVIRQPSTVNPFLSPLLTATYAAYCPVLLSVNRPPSTPSFRPCLRQPMQPTAPSCHPSTVHRQPLPFTPVIRQPSTVNSSSKTLGQSTHKNYFCPVPKYQTRCSQKCYWQWLLFLAANYCWRNCPPLVPFRPRPAAPVLM